METDSFDSLSGSSEELFRCQYPIHHACREGNLETLNYLLASGDSVNFYEEDGFYGWTPIHWAAHFGKLACLRKLTSLGDLGCDISGSQFTQTPLHLSAYTGHPHCVQWLVQSGANINSQDYLGETPLHKAARTGSMECVSLLVSLGAKLGLRNHRGLTPSELAAECGKHECAMYIQKAVDIHHQSSGGFQDPSSGGFQDPSNNLEQQDLSHLNFHNGIYLPQQQQWNNQLHPSHMPNGMTNSGEDCGMETNEIGPGGDAVSHNGFIHTAGMKRCRDDEIEDDSIKRCRKTEPQNWNAWYRPFPIIHPDTPHNELIHHLDHVTQKAAFNNNKLEETDNVTRFDSSSIIEHCDSMEVQQGYDSILEAAIIESHGS